MAEVTEQQTICSIVAPMAQMIEDEYWREQFIEWLKFLEWVEMDRYKQIEKGVKTQQYDYRLFKQIRKS